MYIENDHHTKYGYQLITLYSYKIFLLMRTFKMYSPSNFQMNSTMLTVVINAIHSMTYLSFNWSFVPF